MRKTALAVLLISGCASAPPTPVEPVKQTVPAPMCSGAVECGQMWQRAYDAVQMVTKMRVRAFDDHRIETFVGPVMTGSVAKVPVNETDNLIQARFECKGPLGDCNKLLGASIDLFNINVWGAENLARKQAAGQAPPLAQ